MDGDNRLSKKIVMDEVKKHSKANDVDTSHRRECKNEIETTANPGRPEFKMYTTRVELEAGTVSDPIKERMVQDIVGIEEDIMFSSKHH